MLFAIAFATADVPSFNCSKASTTVEKMICADAELAAVDRAAAKLYAGVSRSDREQLFTSQADWLKERDQCQDRDCLLASYDERLFDLFAESKTPTRNYGSTESNGRLSILDVGGGWYAFRVIAFWKGPGSGQVNDTWEYGHFRLVNGKAEKPPTEDECGWQFERMSRDRWKFTETYPNDERRAVGCGGLNARATGLYSR